MSAAIAEVSTTETLQEHWFVKRWLKPLHLAESLTLSLALAAMTIIPLAEIVLRRMSLTGISGAPSLVQHLSLIVGMTGAVIAARENRLLSLSTAIDLLKGRLQWAAHIFCGGFAAAIGVSLCIAGVLFVTAEREAGKILAYGIPIWFFQALIPVGFAFVSMRLIHHSSNNWTGRLVAVGVAAAIVITGIFPPISSPQLVIPGLILLAIATGLGVPVFVTLGGVALILLWGRDVPIASLPVDQYSLVVNPAIPTIPLFTLAGYFLAEGGAPKRLVRVFRALFGGIPGGSAIVTALACAFFTSFTGASGITIVAIGGLLMPVLMAERYSEKTSLGLVTGSGSLGLLFPPCLPPILYAIIAKVPIEDIFLAGIIPGVLMVAGTACWGIWQGRHSNVPKQSFEWSEARSAIWQAKWELLLPVVTLAALFGGFATPVEAAALTALYAFVAEVVLYRDLSLRRDVLRVMTECGLLVGGVLLILGVALGLTNYVVDADVTARTVEWTTSAIHSRWVFLLALNGFLLIVGCLMDIYSAIVIQVPLLVPIAAAFGVDPLHLGIIFLANLEVGYLTPPVGLNLFMASYRFGRPVPEVVRAVMPIVIVMFAVVLLITYVPWLTTGLPSLLRH
jgi:tripartite ATP-independent transporter DctM subunit